MQRLPNHMRDMLSTRNPSDNWIKPSREYGRMTYVIRSMTTTDYNWRTNEPVTPYHIYLMRPEYRTRAYWTPAGPQIQQFDTPQAAEVEATRLGLVRCDVVPRDHREFPTYWELRDMAKQDY